MAAVQWESSALHTEGLASVSGSILGGQRKTSETLDGYCPSGLMTLSWLDELKVWLGSRQLPAFL